MRYTAVPRAYRQRNPRIESVRGEASRRRRLAKRKSRRKKHVPPAGRPCGRFPPHTEVLAKADGGSCTLSPLLEGSAYRYRWPSWCCWYCRGCGCCCWSLALQQRRRRLCRSQGGGHEGEVRGLGQDAQQGVPRRGREGYAVRGFQGRRPVDRVAAPVCPGEAASRELLRRLHASGAPEDAYRSYGGLQGVPGPLEGNQRQERARRASVMEEGRQAVNSSFFLEWCLVC